MRYAAETTVLVTGATDSLGKRVARIPYNAECYNSRGGGVSQAPLTYEDVIDRFLAWARPQPDVRAVMVVGSRARTDHPADAFSDLDLVVVTTDPNRYLSETDWLKALGTPWLTFLERQAVGEGLERRVLFEGALDVDLIPLEKEAVRRMALEGSPRTSPTFFGGGSGRC